MKIYYHPKHLCLSIENRFNNLDKEYDTLAEKTWKMIAEYIEMYCIQEEMNFFFRVGGFCLTRNGEDIESDFEVNIAEMLKFFEERFGDTPLDFEFLYEGKR